MWLLGYKTLVCDQKTIIVTVAMELIIIYRNLICIDCRSQKFGKLPNLLCQHSISFQHNLGPVQCNQTAVYLNINYNVLGLILPCYYCMPVQVHINVHLSLSVIAELTGEILKEKRQWILVREHVSESFIN